MLKQLLVLLQRCWPLGLSVTTKAHEGRSMANEQIRITVFDTTLRDGEQSPGCSMNQQEKLRLAHQFDRLGVDVIEAGFPIASDGDFESVQAIASVVRGPR